MEIKNINISGISIFDSSLITNGLTLRLDAQNPASYNGSGSTWYDISGNNADITLINSPTYSAGPPSYFTFASASSQRGTGSTSNVLPQTQYSKTVWFRLNSNTDNNLVSSDTGGHFMFFSGTSTLYCGHSNWGSYTAFPSATSFNLNTWYYAALTFNTTDGMVLYVNGTQNATYTANKTAHNGNGSVNVACFGVGNFLNGRIAEVYCYNRALTATEVSQNFNASRARYGL